MWQLARPLDQPPTGAETTADESFRALTGSLVLVGWGLGG